MTVLKIDVSITGSARSMGIHRTEIFDYPPESI